MLVNQRDKHLIDLFIGRRKPSHGLIQALTDQRAGEHQLGRRRLVRAIGMMRHSRLRRCHIAFHSAHKSKDLVTFSRGVSSNKFVIGNKTVIDGEWTGISHHRVESYARPDSGQLLLSLPRRTVPFELCATYL